jgi:UDP-2,3-diacylglucosamine hydrolase
MSRGDLVFVSDSHLEAEDAALAAFLRFLEARARDTATLYLVGDIFNIWLGAEAFTMDHQRPVIAALEALRGEGVRTVMVEGNREFFLERLYEGRCFDRVEPLASEESFGGRRIHVSHGDLLNTDDRPYRVWRRLSKSRPVWWAFRSLPSPVAVGLANRLESRMRGMNLRHKRSFPEEHLREHGRRLAEEGFDAAVLGHLHVETTLPVRAASGRACTVYVMPGWVETHRFLRVRPGGNPAFETSPEAGRVTVDLP